jgi:hypothetical protein
MPTFSHPGMDVPPEVRRKFLRRITVDGVNLKVELLPSLWRKAPFYGILVTRRRGECVSLTIRRSYARATRSDFDRLVHRIQFEPCSAVGCRIRFLVGDETAAVNPLRRCLRHAHTDLMEQEAKELALHDARAARDDARARSRGMCYKAWVWIHGDGDDYAVVRYFAKRPAKAQLERIARANRSKLLGDWAIERLEAL